MPFTQFFPRTFDAPAIRTYAPNASGVYGISNSNEWVYIGESDDIQSSLLSHLQERGTAIMNRRPTGFVFEVCDRDKRLSRQGRLVSEYGPRCNGPSQTGRTSRYV
ncbi:MAG TPA: hypothetical protein VGN17_14890 [Bryobacteraceae bacterium]|jgi:excinuclease UvrABC nuclease subunit